MLEYEGSIKTVLEKSPKKKCILFIIASWLSARLWWGFEVSRLAIFRVMPKARTHYVSRMQLMFPFASWVCSKNRLYCMSVDKAKDSLVIRELPPLGLN